MQFLWLNVLCTTKMVHIFA